MKDLIDALLGRKRCPWCLRMDKPITRWERWMDRRRPLGHIVWKIDRFSYHIGLWRLGRRWHFFRHDKETDYFA